MLESTANGTQPLPHAARLSIGDGKMVRKNLINYSSAGKTFDHAWLDVT